MGVASILRICSACLGERVTLRIEGRLGFLGRAVSFS